MPPCRLRVREAAHRGVHLDPYLTWSPSEKQLLAMFLLRLLRGVKLTPSLCEAETFGNNERPRRAGAPDRRLVMEKRTGSISGSRGLLRTPTEQSQAVRLLTETWSDLLRVSSSF